MPAVQRGPQRRKQRKRFGLLRLLHVESKGQGEIGSGILNGGRRKFRRQRVWPPDLERRTYDPSKVTLIASAPGPRRKAPDLYHPKVGDRIMTTRRGVGIMRFPRTEKLAQGTLYIEPAFLKVDRRKDAATARQIEKTLRKKK